jgi:hypothetical protein
LKAPSLQPHDRADAGTDAEVTHFQKCDPEIHGLAILGPINYEVFGFNTRLCQPNSSFQQSNLHHRAPLSHSTTYTSKCMCNLSAYSHFVCSRFLPWNMVTTSHPCLSRRTTCRYLITFGFLVIATDNLIVRRALLQGNRLQFRSESHGLTRRPLANVRRRLPALCSYSSCFKSGPWSPSFIQLRQAS